MSPIRKEPNEITLTGSSLGSFLIRSDRLLGFLGSGNGFPGLGRGLFKYRPWPALEDVEQIAFGQGFRVVAAMDLRSWYGVQFSLVCHAVEFFGVGFVVNRFAGAHGGFLDNMKAGIPSCSLRRDGLCSFDEG